MRRTLADRLLLFPSKGPESIDGLTRLEVPFGEEKIEIWSGLSEAAMKDGPEKFVLCFHGNKSRGDREFKRMPRIWGRFPIEFCAMNYPGFGASSGIATLATLAPAALAAFDAVTARANGKLVIVSGHSMGTVAALAVAARRDVAGALLHNPPPLRELIHGRFGWWNLWLGSGLIKRGIPHELDSVANARKATTPAVFLLAGKDRLITSRYHDLVFDAYGGPKRKVELPLANHGMAVSQENLPAVEPALDWLWEQSQRTSCD